uniref:ALK and LTK ligand 1 n=1 Tax=Sus scrofa TaxID=9823 RepID=A0A8D0MNM7_PIG
MISQGSCKACFVCAISWTCWKHQSLERLFEQLGLLFGVCDDETSLWGGLTPNTIISSLLYSPGRPGGRRDARVVGEEPKPWPSLPAASRSAEIFPRDLNLKDKFIKHFTGPVTFSAECRKHFHRLYHNTRDCSTPAYYKRCARLLKRLAASPLCSQT